MSNRQVILDTETTGMRVEDGHRIIEVGCVEMIDRKLTGNHFHRYINPEREVEAGALAVHGISNEFLKDKPVFNSILQELMDFLSGAELVIHNAAFDVSFLNYELMLSRSSIWKNITDHCGVIDSLQIARKLHVGQRNSLDALCKRYGIDNSKREFHGALLDAHLLAQVYLAMTGGQGNFFDSLNHAEDVVDENVEQTATIPLQKHNILIIKATQDELAEHENYLAGMKKQGKCLWEG